MSMIQKTDKFMQYRYKIDEFAILTSATTKLQPHQVTNISIENNFEEDLFPIFKVNLILDPPTYYDIIKNKDTVKFKIRIQKYSNEIGTNKKSLYTDVINDTFSVFLDDSDYQYDADIYEKRRESEGLQKGETSLFELDNNMELFLFKDVYVNNIRTTVNKIISSTNLTTALSWLFSKGNLTNALVSPLDNRKSYSPLVIPPISIIDCIRYLDNQFGFYKKGALIFFGIDRPYILNYKGGCTAWTSNEWKETVLLVLQMSNENTIETGSIVRNNEQKYYINTPVNNVKITNNSITNNVLTGTDAYVINADTDNISTFESGAIVKGNSIKNTMINDTQNEYMGSIYAAQQAANSVVITTTLSNINIDSINPNKQFSFIFEDAKLNPTYKGVYRIALSKIKFIKDGDDFSVEASCIFKKV